MTAEATAPPFERSICSIGHDLLSFSRPTSPSAMMFGLVSSWLPHAEETMWCLVPLSVLECYLAARLICYALCKMRNTSCFAPLPQTFYLLQ